jgi:hypothetical protein
MSNRFEDILEESIDVNGLSKLSVYKRWMFDYAQNESRKTKR